MITSFFFIGFNVLEACLPSLISKVSPTESKGAAMGVYSSSQFFGAFLGGTLGGFCYGAWGSAILFVLCALIGCVWFLIAFGQGSLRKH